MKKHLSLSAIALINLALTAATFAASTITNHPMDSTVVAIENGDEDAITLRKGTTITLRLVETVNSSEVSEGNIVGLEVYGDVLVNGKVVIATGSYAEGEIVKVRKPGIFGRSGLVQIAATNLRTVDGKRIILKGKGLVKKGKDKQLVSMGTSASVSLAGVVIAASGATGGVALIPLVVVGVFIRGGKAVVTRDTILTAVVGENVVIKA